MYIRIVLSSLLVVVFLGSETACAQIFGTKDHADELYEQAKTAVEGKKYAEAIKLAQEGLKQRSNFTDLRLLLGRAYLLTGNFSEARKNILNVLEKDPKYLDAYTYIINVELSDGQIDQAEKYVELALQKFPSNRQFMLRKLAILDEGNKIQKGNFYAEELLQRFSDVSAFNRAVANHYVQNAYYYQRLNNLNAAISSVNRALEILPGHNEAQELAVSLSRKGQGSDAVLNRLELELAAKPNDYDLLLQKLSLLQENYRYGEALSVWRQLQRLYPQDARVSELETELKMEAAAFYTQLDPYMLYASLLENGTGNTEALQKVIGISMSRGAYYEALTWINRGLRSNPRSFELRSQKVDLLEYDRKFTEAAAILRQLYNERPNTTLKERLLALQVQSARYYLSQQQYDLAEEELKEIFRIEANYIPALETKLTIESARRQYQKALETLSAMIQLQPTNERLLLRRIGLLNDAGQIDDASEQVLALMNKYPDNEEYKQLYVENLMQSGTNLMQQDEWNLAATKLREAYFLREEDKEIINYLVNLYSAKHQADSALYFVNHGLSLYPDDKELLLKKSGVLTDLHRYNESAEITAALMERYPYTIRYRDIFKENKSRQAAIYRNTSEVDSAIYTYLEILAIDGRDSTSLLNLSNIYLDKKEYDEALKVSSEAVNYYPDRVVFLNRKVQALIAKKDYVAANKAADSAYTLQANEANKDLALFTKGKTLRNQFGIYYLHSSYDYSENNYNIATLEYRKFYDKGSISGRINYAGRAEGTGLQGEVETFYNHNSQFYSYGLVAYANRLVFPEWRAGYSAFYTLKNGIELELGGRYLKANSTFNSISLVSSVAKGLGDFWFNLRGYAIFEEDNLNTSFNLTGRYYLNTRQDFVFMNLGIGTSPDDRSRLINFPDLVGLLTRFTGVGIRKTIDYRTTLGINGTWITHKVATDTFQNQYDVYFTFMRSF